MVGRSSSLIALGISENGFSSATFTEHVPASPQDYSPNVGLRLEYCAPPPGWGPQKLSRSLRRFRVPIPGLLTDILLSNWRYP